MKRTYHFDTGVNASGGSGILADGHVWLHGTSQIPFDCENVPDRATFLHACDNPESDTEGVFVREMTNTVMVSKFAHFRVPQPPTALEKLKKRHADELSKLGREAEIAALLPDGLSTAPTISNVSEAGGLTPNAWLSFSAPSYDPDRTWNPVAILQSLESAGFEQVPATLCRWGSWRPSPYPGLIEDIPETKGRDELTDNWPIAPLWVRPCQHTNADAILFMRKAGKLFRVSVDLPSGVVSLRFPGSWHSHQLCTIQERSRAQVDTDQGVSGQIYFSPHDDQSEWDTPASEFLDSLLQVD